MTMKKMKAGVIGLALLMSSSAIYAADYDRHWAKDTIEKWRDYNILKGYENGDFRPNNPMTRAELASILVRVFQLPEAKGTTQYMDILAAPDKWYVQDVCKVSELGLMHIEGVFFNPNQPVTREEAAYAVAKAYQLTGDEKVELSFKDEENISDWARNAVESLASKNYINGTPEGNFMPQGVLTRAEILTMLNNITTQLITKPGTYTTAIKGNVVINTSGVTLKNMTIDGDLYVTQGLQDQGLILENVTVTGKVYLNGGKVKMSGQYGSVELATGKSLELVSGTIKELVVNKAGSSLTLGNEATITSIIQNQSITLPNQGNIGSAGGIGGGQGGAQGQEVTLSQAGVYISGKYVRLPVANNSILIDIPALSAEYAPSNRLEGLQISSTNSGAILTSNWGSMNMDTMYSFQEAEKELGMIREVALDLGISPTLVISAVLGGDTLTLGDLLQNYQTAQSMASVLGYELQDTYTFERSITTSQGGYTPIYITLRLQ